MSNIARKIADIERELLALTADQPPNPNQMPLFTVTGTTTTDPQVFVVDFDDGIIRLTEAFADLGGRAFISWFAGNVEIYVTGTVPVNFTVVSLGAFTLV